MGDNIVYFGVVFAVIALCILLPLPKAQGQNMVRLGIGDKNDLVHKALQFSENWQYFVVNDFGKFPCFSWSCSQLDNSGKHSFAPFEFIEEWRHQTTYVRWIEEVNCRKMVQVRYSHLLG